MIKLWTTCDRLLKSSWRIFEQIIHKSTKASSIHDIKVDIDQKVKTYYDKYLAQIENRYGGMHYLNQHKKRVQN